VNFKRLLFVLLAVLLLSTSAMVAAQDEPITLQFANWASAEESTRENINAVIAAFEADHPNVTIENVAIPYIEMRTQLLTQSAGGNPPDVMQLSGAWAHELGGFGALIDLNTLAEADFLADNYAGGLEAGTYNDALYAIPYGMSPHGLWWNKELFEQAGLDPEQPPQTMEELFEVAAVLRENLPEDVYPLGLDTSRIDYALTGFWPWILTYGGRPMYNGDYNFNTPEVQKAFEFLDMAVANNWTPTGANILEERELMANGRIAMKLDGPYLVGIFRSLNPALEGDAFYDTFGVTTVPVGVEGAAPVTLADIHQLGISTQTQHPELAWEFTRFLAESELSVRDYMVPLGMIPPLQSHVELYPDLFENPISRAYVDGIIESMVGGPYDPQYGASQQFVIEGMQMVSINRSPIEEALNRITTSLSLIYGQ
jgi:multiple sugar transport system substrate-binding protein